MVPHVTCVTLCPQDLFLGIIRILMLSCYFQEKQRSFTSGDFWVLLRWQVTHFQFLSVFQDGGQVKFPTMGQRLKINVKIPTQGKARSVNFPWVARPPLTLGLNIDRCIIVSLFLVGSCTFCMYTLCTYYYFYFIFIFYLKYFYF